MQIISADTTTEILQVQIFEGDGTKVKKVSVPRRYLVPMAFVQAAVEAKEELAETDDERRARIAGTAKDRNSSLVGKEIFVLKEEIRGDAKVDKLRQWVQKDGCTLVVKTILPKTVTYEVKKDAQIIDVQNIACSKIATTHPNSKKISKTMSWYY